MNERLFRVLVVIGLVASAGLSAMAAFAPPETPARSGYGQYGSIQIVGNENLKVGNGTPDTSLNGEDAYVEGTFEVDGAVNLDGNLDVDGTTNLDDLDVDASGEIEIDGGLTDFGGGSYDTADGDNDVGVAGDLEVDGELELDGALDADSTSNFADTVTIAGGLMLPAADATAAFTATASDCGKTYFLNAETEFATTLPAMSTVSAGCSFQFIVKAAPSGADYTVITGNSLENVLIGGVNELEVDTGNDGPTSTADDTLTFSASGGSAVGDYVYLISDGTSWYYRGQAAADGGLVPSQAD